MPRICHLTKRKLVWCTESTAFITLMIPVASLASWGESSLMAADVFLLSHATVGCRDYSIQTSTLTSTSIGISARGKRRPTLLGRYQAPIRHCLTLCLAAIVLSSSESFLSSKLSPPSH